MAAPHTSRR
jgi:hypothetical protein